MKYLKTEIKFGRQPKELSQVIHHPRVFGTALVKHGNRSCFVTVNINEFVTPHMSPAYGSKNNTQSLFEVDMPVCYIREVYKQV